MTVGEEEWTSGADFQFKTPGKRKVKSSAENVRSPINTRRRTTMALGQHKGPLLAHSSDEEDSPSKQKTISSGAFYTNKKISSTAAAVTKSTVQSDKNTKSKIAKPRASSASEKASKYDKATSLSSKTATTRRRSMIAKTTETNVVLRTPAVTTTRRTRRSVAAGLQVSPVTETTIQEVIAEELLMKTQPEQTNREDVSAIQSSQSSVTVVMSTNHGLIEDTAVAVSESPVPSKIPALSKKQCTDVEEGSKKSEAQQELPKRTVKRTPGRQQRKSGVTVRVEALSAELCNVELPVKKTPGRPKKTVSQPVETTNHSATQKTATPGGMKDSVPKSPEKKSISKTTETKSTKGTPGRPRKSLPVPDVHSQLKADVSEQHSSLQKRMTPSIPRKSVTTTALEAAVSNTAEQASTISQPAGLTSCNTNPNAAVATSHRKSISSALPQVAPSKTTAAKTPTGAAAKPKMMAIRSKRAAPDPVDIVKLAENITPEPSVEHKSRSRKRHSTTSKPASPEKIKKSEPRRRKPTPDRLTALKKQTALDMSMGDNSLFATPEVANMTRKAAQAYTPFLTPQGKATTAELDMSASSSSMDFDDTIVTSTGDASILSSDNESSHQSAVNVPPAARSWCSIM